MRVRSPRAEVKGFGPSWAAGGTGLDVFSDLLYKSNWNRRLTSVRLCRRLADVFHILADNAGSSCYWDTEAGGLFAPVGEKEYDYLGWRASATALVLAEWASKTITPVYLDGLEEFACPLCDSGPVKLYVRGCRHKLLQDTCGRGQYRSYAWWHCFSCGKLRVLPAEDSGNPEYTGIYTFRLRKKVMYLLRQGLSPENVMNELLTKSATLVKLKFIINCLKTMLPNTREGSKSFTNRRKGVVWSRLGTGEKKVGVRELFQLLG